MIHTVHSSFHWHCELCMLVLAIHPIIKSVRGDYVHVPYPLFGQWTTCKNYKQTPASTAFSFKQAREAAALKLRGLGPLSVSMS